MNHAVANGHLNYYDGENRSFSQSFPILPPFHPKPTYQEHQQTSRHQFYALSLNVLQDRNKLGKKNPFSEMNTARDVQ